MAVYQTKQRQLMGEFFQNNPHKVFSATQLVQYFAVNHNISASTIYRNLAELDRDGEIRQVTNIGGRDTHYQYVGSQDCKGQIHMLCSVCHQSMHMSSDTMHYLSQQLLTVDGFAVDNNSSVIYGVCKHCR